MLRKFLITIILLLTVAGALTIWVAGQSGRPIATPGSAAQAETPTTAPSAVAASSPTTLPTTQPLGCTIFINQTLRDFPAARLRIETADDHVTAILYSADPATAIDNDYTGNSFYLRMPMDGPDATGAPDEMDWHFKAISSDRNDSSDGIFLQGLRHQLQPMDVVVRIEGHGAHRQVRIAGEFMDFDTSNPRQPGEPAMVNGNLTAEVDVTGNGQ
jgi:hypothetical protein